VGEVSVDEGFKSEAACNHDASVDFDNGQKVHVGAGIQKIWVFGTVKIGEEDDADDRDEANTFYRVSFTSSQCKGCIRRGGLRKKKKGGGTGRVLHETQAK
jgi:hypothetical protein